MHSFIHAAREREKHSACCVRNDRSGCVQTSEEECSVSARPQLSSHPCLHLVFVVILGLQIEPVGYPKPLVLSTLCRPSLPGPLHHILSFLSHTSSISCCSPCTPVSLIFFFFFFMAALQGLRDPSSPTRDRTQARH